MYLVGLTGGIGSGKSTVAARFVELGADLIDADRVAREIVEPGGAALVELADRFGSNILQPDGSLDRVGLARLAFAGEEERAALEAITHPRIAARIDERVAALRSAPDRSDASDPGIVPEIVVVDHPLLVETGQDGRFDAVVVVQTDEEERIRRLVEQRGLREPDVRARIAAQASDESRRAVATHVITNGGTRHQLLERADEVYAELATAARTAAAR